MHPQALFELCTSPPSQDSYDTVTCLNIEIADYMDA